MCLLIEEVQPFVLNLCLDWQLEVTRSVLWLILFENISFAFDLSAKFGKAWKSQVCMPVLSSPDQEVTCKGSLIEEIDSVRALNEEYVRAGWAGKNNILIELYIPFFIMTGCNGYVPGIPGYD